MPLTSFHPSVSRWFQRELGPPTEPQLRGWPEVRRGRHTLIAAPTGSGKTLAAFLAALDDLVRDGLEGRLEDATRVLYVSPLKALGNDIEKNLQRPLTGISRELEAMGLLPVEIRTMVRTGDTPSRERARMVRRPPHVVVTTPESLFILVTSEGGRRLMRTVRTVIVDEIHALIGDKRGSHLALSLERLEALAERPPMRIGLSATQRPIEKVARFLVGGASAAGEDRPAPCSIVDSGHVRRLDVALELPRSPLEAVMAGEVWLEIYDRLAELIAEHRTTLVFVNTRRTAERLTRHLSERLGEGAVTSHHGSMSREHRFDAEQRLKSGQLRALVATASLELGIDIGDVELVCQIGSTRSIATFLQRVGRAGHHLRGVPKGRLFPLSRDELVESAALLDAVRRGELDAVVMPERPLDILAQQLVAAVACEEWEEDALYALVRKAYPYRDLPRADFDAVVRMLSQGFATRRGRRGARLHRDGVHRRLRARKGARLAAITSGGAIPEVADYDVVLEPTGERVGSLNEDFAIESMSGDIFQLGNVSWRILRVEPGRVRVEDAKGQPPTIPFWFGEAPSRTRELSAAVSRLRRQVDAELAPEPPSEADVARVAERLAAELGLERSAAEQLAAYLAAGRAALGAMPTLDTLVVERFFDDSGSMQLVVHAPFGSRINRAFGLSLRKRFCQKFNFELQAAATEDGVVLSLGPTHSFPLAEVFSYLRSGSVRELLVQALLDAPMFATRWRWNANRSLAVLRWRGGKKVPPRFQRMEADDLLTVVFPDQVACAENVQGRREIPEHPLVDQTLRDCLVEAMDIEGFEALLDAMARGEKRLVACDLTEPSPFSQELLGARPYAFLDDAPLEERRTQAVFARRWLDPQSAAELGTLDAGAIERVRGEAWPAVESADELHDGLLTLGFWTEAEGRARGHAGLFEALTAAGRATVLRAGASGEQRLWIAAERIPELEAVYGEGRLAPPVVAPPDSPQPESAEAALVEILRSRLEGTGPATVERLAREGALPRARIEAALAALEAQGTVLRGRFTPGGAKQEWCERGLLARIHRYTLTRLRSEIEPVPQADFVRFLLSWQRVAPGAAGRGPEALAAVLEQLEGFEAPAAAWEGEILPARVSDYDPSWLDALCLSGRTAWTRLTRPPVARGARSGPVRATPTALVRRAALPLWMELSGRVRPEELAPSAAGRRVLTHLASAGATFFDDLVGGTGLLRTEVEQGLSELVAWGVAHSDSFGGLRALLLPSNLRAPLSGGSGRRRRGGVALFGMETAGRWSLLDGYSGGAEEALEHAARALLRRYGVVFRRLLEREGAAPPWRELLRVYRRLEARGEIRGGRFVSGFSGEQFALADAVGLLRAERRGRPDGSLVSVSAADPLNVVGIALPGERVPAISTNRVLFRDGVPVATKVGEAMRFIAQVEPGTEWELKSALLRRTVPPQLRAYLGKSA